MTSVRGGAARRLALAALEQVTGGTVTMVFPDGRGRRFGDGEGPDVRVQVRNPDALWEALGRRTRVGLGEAYVAGAWECDDLTGLLTLLGRTLEQREPARWLRALRTAQARRPSFAERQTPRAARDNIQAHYDLGNELFALMLDPTMSYSCAYWEHPEMTLEQAQDAKHARIAAKLRLDPSDHVLEIGCGWGGFAMHAAGEHGCRVTGLTLSPAQASLARQRVHDAGLDGLVEILERDYRHVDGAFTKIVSIEMLEAIGLSEYNTFFATADRLLADNGIAVVQTIGVPDERFERYRRTHDWIREHVFPGSLLPSVNALSRAIARTRLMLVDLEEIGIGYARTLGEWRSNVDRHEPELRRLGYDDRFLRTWRYYLCFCEAGFAIRVLRDVQLVLSRPANDSLPANPQPQVTF